jgi:hypothetical protein
MLRHNVTLVTKTATSAAENDGRSHATVFSKFRPAYNVNTVLRLRITLLWIFIYTKNTELKEKEKKKFVRPGFETEAFCELGKRLDHQTTCRRNSDFKR